MSDGAQLEMTLTAPRTQRIAGISGGRTSALMACEYVPSDTVLCFQNTGKEHPKTLEFVARLEDHLRRPIVRLEWRAPVRGEPPAKATFEIVEHGRLSRKGEPFRDLLSSIAAYRLKHKGLGPIAPWARSRICTAYLKIRTQEAYVRSLGWLDPEIYVGLRADEPDRIAKMRARNNDRDRRECAPLNDASIVKADVLAFWKKMPFDLDLPEHLGNCTGCFLKDESDLATALLDEETDAAWWLAIEDDFAPMRSEGRPSYAQVLAEAPERMKIRARLADGIEAPTAALPPHRLKLIVRQETRRLKEQRSSFSCHCEGAEKMDDGSLLEAP